MAKFTQIAAAGQTIYLIDENGKAWCVEYYGITERERWKEIVHPDDLPVVEVLRCLHTWATDHPPRPVEDVMWDGHWGCYTYSFPLSLIRIEEHKLIPSGDPDITPEEWIAQYRTHEAQT